MSQQPFIGIDMTEVKELAVDLIFASTAVMPAVEKIVEVGANKIKNEARVIIAAADVNGRLPAYPSSITYDMDVDPTGSVSAEIGPDKDRAQGPLGNVLEYGTSRSAPVPHLQPALENEVPIIEAEIGAAAGLMWKRRHP